jgi:hypothetical protein
MFSSGEFTFLLHLFLEDLVILALVSPILLEAPTILFLLVFIFLLEGNLKLRGNLKSGGNLKLGCNLKLEAITQFMGKVYPDYNLDLEIFLSKGLNNYLGGKILKLIILYPLTSGNRIQVL